MENNEKVDFFTEHLGNKTTKLAMRRNWDPGGDPKVPI